MLLCTLPHFASSGVLLLRKKRTEIIKLASLSLSLSLRRMDEAAKRKEKKKVVFELKDNNLPNKCREQETKQKGRCVPINMSRKGKARMARGKEKGWVDLIKRLVPVFCAYLPL